MKSALTALLAICICLPLMADDAAKKKFEEARAKAERGDVASQWNLGLMYANGEVVEQNFKEAMKWFHKAAERDEANQYLLGMLYLNSARTKEAVNWLRKAADQRYPLAQKELSAAYRKGEGVERDEFMSYVWLKVVATSGYGFSDLRDLAKRALPLATKQLEPNQINEAGQRVKELEKRFFEIALKNSVSGNAWAFTSLGDCYLGGFGVAKDKKKAIESYRISANRNEVNAQYMLGFIYGHGWNYSQNGEEGIKWFQRAGANGETRAFRELGSMYWNGVGVPEDKVSGLAWAKVGKIKGNDWASSTYKGYSVKATPTEIAKADILTKELLNRVERLKKESQAD